MRGPMVFFLAGMAWPLSLQAKESALEATVLDRPPVSQSSTLYIGNRPPLLPSPLVKLPIGDIEPRGWLRHQLELEAEGMTGHLTELSHWCRFEDSAWTRPDGQGDLGWEEMPYWLKGFGDLGYVLKDERMIAEARKWIDAVLNTQRPDGYFGPETNLKSHDVWPNMVMLNVLQSFYEATGDERVLPFMSRYVRWELKQGEALLPGSWQKIRAGDNLESAYWLYNRTGESFLLDAAELIHRRTANWTEEIPTWHGVNICQSYREPAVYFQQSKDTRFWEASEANYQKVMALYGQVPGGLFGADENARPGYDDPRQGAETCSMVEFMRSFELLLAISGDPLFADRCEEVAFNSLPAAMTPDLKGLHYLTGPNMIQLDRASKSPLLQNGGCMLAFSPDERYRCCQHNVSHGWPFLAEHLWMATGDQGLAALFFLESQVKAKVGRKGIEVTLSLQSDYPFSEKVQIQVSAPRAATFPLYVRIPRWATDATLLVNGTPVNADIRPSAYVRLLREWQENDLVELRCPMEIRLRTWEKNHGAVSVDRGPLTYSLKIEERWEKCGGTEAWPDWEVFPATPWNYGLALEGEKPSDWAVSQLPVPGQPFTPDAAPVRIKAKARKIPEWEMEQGMIGLLQDSPARTDEPEEEIELIPMGCARLRVSAFPVASTSPQAGRWEEPPM